MSGSGGKQPKAKSDCCVKNLHGRCPNEWNWHQWNNCLL